MYNNYKCLSCQRGSVTIGSGDQLPRFVSWLCHSLTILLLWATFLTSLLNSVSSINNADNSTYLTGFNGLTVKIHASETSVWNIERAK